MVLSGSVVWDFSLRGAVESWSGSFMYSADSIAARSRPSRKVGKRP